MAGHNPSRLAFAQGIVKDPTFLEIMEIGREEILKRWRDAKTLEERELAHGEFVGWERLPGRFTAIAGSELISQHAERKQKPTITT